MYRHLLVAIDATSLTSHVVEEAVALASAAGAEVTFFHACRDFASTGDGAMLKAFEPQAFVEAAAGTGHAIVGRAEAAARARGLKPRSMVVSSDRPHLAIAEAVASTGCDLLVVGARSTGGLSAVLHTSVSARVVQKATVPVLVVPEAATHRGAEHHAIGIIKDEHRSLAAVIHGLQQTVTQAVASGSRPDPVLLRAMLYYIEHFPERLHHPKEEIFLFRKLRERTSEHEAVLRGLEAQHADGARRLRELADGVSALERGDAAAVAQLESAVHAFAKGQWQHMAAEEDVILPAALQVLTTTDWQEVAQAFSSNGDPRFDEDTGAAYERLFVKLLNLAAAAPAAAFPGHDTP